jgi:hypothetical protein
MNLEFCISQLSHHGEAIERLTLGLPAEQARWKPDTQAWSILEVVNHLYDEEREDFRIHTDYILYHRDQPWPLIDPQGWVTERGYNQRELGPSVQAFLEQRRKSVDWLVGLKSPDWQVFITAPFGRLSAGDMLASWVAHDLLHMRQLVELHWAWMVGAVAPYQVRYAGEW